MPMIEPVNPQMCGCDSATTLSGLISYDEAVRLLMSLEIARSRTETVPLGRAVGRVLARPVLTATPLPAFDNAAMDGYAIRYADLTGPGPWLLRLGGRAVAGSAGPVSVKQGHAVRILTGAKLPGGADTVVMQEAVQLSGKSVVLRELPKPGANIRFAGGEEADGSVVLQAGKVMTARQIALAATAGAAEVVVYRKLRVVVLSTGNELCATGTALRPGQIRDANGPMLAAELARADVASVDVIPVADNCRDVANHIAWASKCADLVVTSGGASVGDEDHLTSALRLLGARTMFHGVAIKPGKPVMLAQLRGTPVIGLPGNPVAAHVTWALLGRPLLNRLAGLAQPLSQRRLVVARSDLHHKPGRCEFRPATLSGLDETGREVVDAGEATHSARLTILEQADGLVIIPAETERVRGGDLLEFLPL